MELSSILIIDDDAASLARLARLVAELLAEQQPQIRTADNLGNARELLQTHHFDLALVDMQVHAVQDVAFAVPGVEVADLEQRRAHASVPI